MALTTHITAVYEDQIESVCLRRRQAPGEITPVVSVEDTTDLPSDTYDLTELRPDDSEAA